MTPCLLAACVYYTEGVNSSLPAMATSTDACTASVHIRQGAGRIQDRSRNRLYLTDSRNCTHNGEKLSSWPLRSQLFPRIAIW
jgi:hypothetical protein